MGCLYIFDVSLMQERTTRNGTIHKDSREMKEVIDAMIVEYTVKRRRKQLQNLEIKDFMRFFIAFTESDDKYKQMQTPGLSFIHRNRKEIYQKISEAVPSIHNRGKGYQSILSSEEVGSGRRRSRRLV